MPLVDNIYVPLLRDSTLPRGLWSLWDPCGRYEKAGWPCGDSKVTCDHRGQGAAEIRARMIALGRRGGGCSW